MFIFLSISSRLAANPVPLSLWSDKTADGAAGRERGKRTAKLSPFLIFQFRLGQVIAVGIDTEKKKTFSYPAWDAVFNPLHGCKLTNDFLVKLSLIFSESAARNFPLTKHDHILEPSSALVIIFLSNTDDDDDVK